MKKITYYIEPLEKVLQNQEFNMEEFLYFKNIEECKKCLDSIIAFLENSNWKQTL